MILFDKLSWHIISLLHGFLLQICQQREGEMTIRYRVNFEKAVETILWLAREKPDIDIYHIGKTIFYAEKLHLNRYARPLIGDAYQRGDYGPFPSTVRDIVHQKSNWLDNECIQKCVDSFNVKYGLYATPIPKRSPDMDFFSETDIECLRNALKAVGDLPFDELKRMTHEEESFLAAINNDQLNYELLIDEDNPLRAEIVEEMRETSRYVCV